MKLRSRSRSSRERIPHSSRNSWTISNLSLCFFSLSPFLFCFSFLLFFFFSFLLLFLLLLFRNSKSPSDLHPLYRHHLPCAVDNQSLWRMFRRRCEGRSPWLVAVPWALGPRPASSWRVGEHYILFHHTYSLRQKFTPKGPKQHHTKITRVFVF